VNKAVLMSVVFTALAAVSGGVGAQSAEKVSGPKTPWYGGAGISINYTKIPDETIDGANADLMAAYGATTLVTDRDEQSTGLKFFLGYRLNQNFAVEAGYAALGESKANSDFRTGAPSVSVGSFNLKYKMTAPFIDAVGILPLGDRWSLLGRIGVAYTRTSVDIDAQPLTLVIANSEKSESKIREKLGVGADYRLSPQVSIRAEWERYKGLDPLSNEDFNVDAATLSAVYLF